jgi:LuxR family transcriptional regulator, glucitol operon activator
MDLQFTQRDVGYTIISRFEEIFRFFISYKLSNFYSTFYDGIPMGIVDCVKERKELSEIQNPEDFLEFTDLTHLHEIVIFKKNFNIFFPAMKQKDFSQKMDEIYSLRCKIAHIRESFTHNDANTLIELTKDIAINFSDFDSSFLDFLDLIIECPEKVTVNLPTNYYAETHKSTIPHNFPTPDYEYEGGFIGRDEDVKKIMSMLEGDLHRVITISGAGGVGKTALASRIVQKYLASIHQKFDGIIWLTAKETKLSYLGIEDLEPTIKSYEELLNAIFEVMGFGKPSEKLEALEKDVYLIFELISCILIVIDNLETISDPKIINFILDAHPKLKILITSRKGLGQVERRHELKQLQEKEAVYLFRSVANEKKLNSLAKLDDETIRKYTKKVSCYPLAIKWVVGQVAIGKEINNVIDKINQTTSDISKFCFEEIYDSLSINGKKVLCTLSLFDKPPSTGVLGYVADLNQFDLEDTIRELLLVSLLIPEQAKNNVGDIITYYSILSLTRGYVREQLDKNPTLRNELTHKLQLVESQVEEAERAKKQYRFSLSYLGANSDEEKVAAMYAQTALQKYQSGRYPEAVDDYKRAIQIAPRFASIYRNWALMEAQEGHSPEAEELIKKAANLAPNDPQIWLTWGNIKRREDRIKESLQKYEQANKLSPNDSVIMNALGQAKTRLGEYEEAEILFTTALNQENFGDSYRHKVINLTSIADNQTRWAENYVNEKDYKNAEIKLLNALHNCDEAIRCNTEDIRTQTMYRKIVINLGYLYKCNLIDYRKSILYFNKGVVNKPRSMMKYREAKDTIISALNSGKLYFSLGELDQAKKIFTQDLKRLKFLFTHDPKLQREFDEFYKILYSTPETFLGKITKFSTEKKFIIIECMDDATKTYIGFINGFIPTIKTIDSSIIGKKVRFAVDYSFTQGPRAINITFQ